jgi:8-oxo-dGTP diphosphatase
MPETMKYSVTTDAVVFTLREGELQILLIRRKTEPFKSQLALPGGFLEPYDKSLEDCAKRELWEETGVKDIFLRQLSAYGDIGRDPRFRTITVAFLAVINSKHIKLNEPRMSEEAQWIEISGVGRLAFDHNKILDEALLKLRREIMRSSIASQLLSERFTLSEMQRTYEVILGKALDKRNFRKWIKNLNLLKETGETRMEGVHRPAMLYQFREKGYTRFG